VNVEIQSEGFWELDAKLQAIGSETAEGRSVTDGAMRSGASVLLAAIRSKTPVLSGRMLRALRVARAFKRKPGVRILEVGFFGEDLSSETKYAYKSGRTGKHSFLRWFYPTAVEYGHDVPYASIGRFERGERIARSKSQSLNLSQQSLSRMTDSMRNHKLKLAARGTAMNAALAATKKIPPHPFIRPAFESAAPRVADAIITRTVAGINQIWERRQALAAAGKIA
jgi:hypothetical protein